MRALSLELSFGFEAEEVVLVDDVHRVDVIPAEVRGEDVRDVDAVDNITFPTEAVVSTSPVKDVVNIEDAVDVECSVVDDDSVAVVVLDVVVFEFDGHNLISGSKLMPP